MLSPRWLALLRVVKARTTEVASPRPQKRPRRAGVRCPARPWPGPSLIAVGVREGAGYQPRGVPRSAPASGTRTAERERRNKASETPVLRLQSARRATEDSNVRPTAPEAVAEEHKANHCATLREHGGRRVRGLIHGDSRCSEVIRRETSRERMQNAATARSLRAEPRRAVEETSVTLTTGDDALHLAIELAVDARDYERASALIEIARRTPPKTAGVTTLALARERRPR